MRNDYPRSLADHADDDLAVDEILEDLLAEAAEGEDTDHVISLRSFPGHVPDNRLPSGPIPPKFRNIAYGEITTTSGSKSREGLANLNQDMIYPHLRNVPTGAQGRPLAGYPTLVQYDPKGNVYMRVLSSDQQQILWQGNLGNIRLPTSGTKGERDRTTEDRVRALVARATGQKFRPHGANTGGADLVRSGATRQTRSGATRQTRGGATRPARGSRQQRFDGFVDALVDSIL